MLASDIQAHAEKAVQQAATKPLTDDAAYRRWPDKVGDAGILNFYVAKRATNLPRDCSTGSTLAARTSCLPAPVPDPRGPRRLSRPAATTRR